MDPVREWLLEQLRRDYPERGVTAGPAGFTADGDIGEPGQLEARSGLVMRALLHGRRWQAATGADALRQW